MQSKWRCIIAAISLYALVSALFYAVVFGVVGLSDDFLMDMFFGAIAGMITGLLIAIIIGTAENIVMPAAAVGQSGNRFIFDIFIGVFAGALLSTAVIVIMVPLLGYLQGPPPLLIQGALLGRLIGTPLGTVVGALIGATWGWLGLKMSNISEGIPVNP